MSEIQIHHHSSYEWEVSYTMNSYGIKKETFDELNTVAVLLLQSYLVCCEKIACS